MAHPNDSSTPAGATVRPDDGGHGAAAPPAALAQIVARVQQRIAADNDGPRPASGGHPASTGSGQR
ncbi:hypothetical protein ACN27F_11910 [Solwaraspora sp. WMMB335]|uniref:hypothetical protein n=1 Tax=Solwaraspora sp. WMMB335 TaxID=3404118 RepID=UPI003B923A0B